MIPIGLAARLKQSGLVWHPGAGDRFVIPDKDMDDEVFVVSTMTIEVHDLPAGTVIGFNGTTEWALDDVAKDQTIWLPREDQLRELLGAAFCRLDRDGTGYRVTLSVEGEAVEVTGVDAETAYARALLHTMTTSPGARGRRS